MKVPQQKEQKQHTVKFFCYFSRAVLSAESLSREEGRNWQNTTLISLLNVTNIVCLAEECKTRKDRIMKHPKFLEFAQAKKKQVASHNVFVWITYSFIPLDSCHPEVISIIMASVRPNGILAVIMYASVLCRHYQPCHPESHKCNYTKPLITKQCNLLLE